MKALFIVDMQNDFMPWGTLPVPGSDTLIPIINHLMDFFSLIIASRDAHPEHHISFATTHPGRKAFETITYKGKTLKLWPEHCVKNTPGADFSKGLNIQPIQKVFYKAEKENQEAFSVFFDEDKQPTLSCHRYLQSLGVTSLYLCGVATEVCVKANALDACKLGYEVFIIAEACRGITKEGENAAIQEIQKQGIHVISLTKIRD